MDDLFGYAFVRTDLTSSGSGGSKIIYDPLADDLIVFTGLGRARVDIHGGDDTVITSGYNDVISDNTRGNFYGRSLDGSYRLVRGGGPSGDDTVLAGAGDDTIIAGDGANRYDGESGADTVDYSRASIAVSVNLRHGTGQGDGTDSLISIENVVGSRHSDSLTGSDAANHLSGGNGHDTLVGLAGQDTLLGGDGDDTLSGGADGDLLDGGNGIDTISYRGSSQGVTIDLVTGRGAGGDAEGDTFFNVENVRGSSFADTLTGDANDNVLTGGAGRDVLTGGRGADRFVFQLSSDSTVKNPDRIDDFTKSVDKIDLALLGAAFDDGLTLVDHFTGQAGQVDVAIGKASTMVFVDLDGDMIADFSLELIGRINLAAVDFVL